MDRGTIKKALISILIGAAIMMLNQVMGLLLELLKNNQEIVIPSVGGMLHFLTPWRMNRIV